MVHLNVKSKFLLEVLQMFKWVERMFKGRSENVFQIIFDLSVDFRITLTIPHKRQVFEHRSEQKGWLGLRYYKELRHVIKELFWANLYLQNFAGISRNIIRQKSYEKVLILGEHSLCKGLSQSKRVWNLSELLKLMQRILATVSQERILLEDIKVC